MLLKLLLAAVVFVQPMATALASTDSPGRAVCPIRRSLADLKLPTGKPSVKEIGDAMLAYLNDGGSYTGFRHLFEVDGRGSAVPVDLNGDGVEEIAITLVIWIESWGRVAWMGIYECADGKYVEHLYSVNPGYISDVRIIRIVDLMGLGFPQVWFEYTEQISACNVGVAPLSWNGSEYDFHLTKATVFCGGSATVTDYDGDGVKEVLLRGSNQGNLEYGIGRGIVRVFHWQGDDMALESETLLPSPYRIHVLQDAQIALDGGDTRAAIRKYELAATSRWLKNRPSIYETMNGTDFAQQYQTAFANFRLVVLWTGLQGTNGATRVLERMESAYPSGTEGAEFTILAREFVDQLSGGASPQEACRVVTRDIEARYPYLAGYGYIGNWGLANVAYENEDLCPYR